MLRIAALILLLANAGYALWSLGWLGATALAPSMQGEPERLEQQIRPEQLVVISPAEFAALANAPPPPAPIDTTAPPAPIDAAAHDNTSSTAAAPPTAPTLPCLQAGIFDVRQTDSLRAALAAWPQESWTLLSTPISPRWMVYMGRLADEKAVAAKRTQLRALGIDYDRPGSALEPGLSLGRFSTAEAAHRVRADLERRGIQPVRVVVERAEAPGFTLRLPAVDASVRARLNKLGPALANKTVRACQ